MESNRPPARTPPAPGASANMYTELWPPSRVGLGFHAVAAPLLTSRAAILFRGCPPAVENCPPAYTTGPMGRIARTPASAPGFQEVGCPLVASTAAMLLRVAPPAELKLPPRYTVEPL